jgi:tetratricopeptide (TPR) repeat protein
MHPAPSPRALASRLLVAGALSLSLACTACGGGGAALPLDLREAATTFSGGDDASRAPRFRLLRDSANHAIARACLTGASLGGLGRLGVADLRARLDSLAAGRIVRLDGERCGPGFPVFLGARRRALAHEADAAAERIAPFVESLAVRIDSLVGARRDIGFHLLWSRVMDAAWDGAWRRAFPRDTLPVVTWLVVPAHRLAVGTNFSQTVGGGGLAATWAPRFTEHLEPLGNVEFELSLLGWHRPVTDDSARSALIRFGLLDSLGVSRLFAYPGNGPLDSALDAMARAYGLRAASAADWGAVGARLATDPRDLFIILLHEIAYGVFARLADAGRLDVPRVLTEGTPRTDAARLVSLALGRPPRPADEALAAYTRNGWHGSKDVVRQLRLAVAADPRDVRAHWILGLCLYDIGRYRDAVGAFEWVTAAARRDSSAAILVDWSRIWVGHAYDALGQRPRAVAIYRDVARTGEASEQMMMSQYRIGPVTARTWARQRLETPFHGRMTP